MINFNFTGVEHVGGDMFEKIPSGDAIFMKVCIFILNLTINYLSLIICMCHFCFMQFILHDWNDDHCVKILKNCWKQLPENGKVIICEGILPDEPQEDNLVLYSDMMMLMLFPGGKERMKSEYDLLAKKAGFADFKIACIVNGFFIMEFIK